MEEFKKNSIKKIDSEGPEWSARRMEEQVAEAVHGKFGIVSPQDIFGYELLTSWQVLNRRGPLWENAKKEGEVAAESVRDKIEEAFGIGLELTHKRIKNIVETRSELLVAFANESFAISSPEEIAEMMDLDIKFSMPENDEARENELVELVGKKYKEGWQMPTNALIFLLENHNNAVLQAEKRVIEGIRMAMPKLRNFLWNALLDGRIPISREELIRRVTRVEYTAVDGMTAGLQETWGDFTIVGHKIRISTNVPDDEIESVLMHEMIHALGGQIENEYVLADKSKGENKSLEVIKTGFRFGKDGNKDPRSYKDNLGWFNEALTEEISGSLVGSIRAYPHERELVRLILGNGGISEELVTAVYFENYTGKKEGHQLPKTKEFFRLVNERFGNGFLMNLDKYIKESKSRGKSQIQIATEMWKSLGDQFPKYINEWAEKRAKNYRMMHRIRHILD